MPIRVPGVRMDFDADSSGYNRATQQVVNQTGRIEAGYRRMAGAARSANAENSALRGAVRDVTTSMRSSLVATAAYAAGVGAVRAATAGAIRNFVEWEKSLVAVQKTANLTNEETARLSDNIERLLTVTSSVGRPLAVASRELTQIAEVAGQMAIVGVPAITKFTEVVGQLGLTTDVAGSEAANAIGLILNNTTALVSEVDRVGSVITGLGNAFRGGESEIIAQATRLAQETAQFRLASQDLLALSAVFSSVGARAETAATVVQRSIVALNNAAGEAASGNLGKLTLVADAAGVSFESLQKAISGGDYIKSLRILGQALRNLPAIAPEDVVGRNDLLTLLFGGKTPPVRITGVLGVLSTQLDALRKAQRISNEEWRTMSALTEEVNRALSTTSARFQEVSNRMEADSRRLGESLAGAILPVAENYEAITLGLSGLAGLIGGGFINRKVRQAQETAQEDFRSSQAAVTNSIRDTNKARTEELKLQRRVNDAQKEQARAQTAVIRGGGGDTDKARKELERTTRSLNRAETRYANAVTRTAFATQVMSVATGRATTAQVLLNRASRVGFRVMQGLSALLTFVRGTLPGLIASIAITAATMFFFSRRTEEAVDALKNAAAELSRVNDQIINSQQSLPETELTYQSALAGLTSLYNRMAELNAEREKLRQDLARPLSVSAPDFREQEAIRREQRSRLEQIDEERGRIRESAELLNKEAAGFRSANRVVNEFRDEMAEINRQFFRLTINISDADAKLQIFLKRLTSRTTDALAEAVFEQGQIDSFPEAQLFDRLAFAEQRAIQEGQRKAAAELEVEQRKLNVEKEKTRLLDEQLRSIHLDPSRVDAIKSDVRDQKTAQEQQAQRVEIAREYLDVLLRQRVDEEALRDLARERLRLDFLRAARAPETFEDNTIQQYAQVQRFIDGINDQVVSLNRETERFRDTLGVPIDRRAGVFAYFDTIDQHRDRLRGVNRDIGIQRALYESLTEKIGEITDAQNVNQAANLERFKSQRQATGQTLLDLVTLQQFLTESTGEVEDGARRIQNAVNAQAEAYREARSEVRRYRDSIVSWADELDSLQAGAVRNFEDALVGLVDRTESLAQHFRNLADVIAKDLLRAVIRLYIVKPLLDQLVSIGTLFGRGGNAGGPLGDFSSFPSGNAHAGGIVGNLPPAPRRGLRSDEQIVVLQRGEEVLPAYDPRHRYNLHAQTTSGIRAFIDGLPRYHSGGIPGGRPQPSLRGLRIEVINDTRRGAELVDNGERIEGSEVIRSFLLKEIRDRGPVAQAIEGLPKR